MNEPIYRLMAEEDAEKVYELVKKVFDRFVAQAFDQKGIEQFYEIINPESILRRREENHFALIAEVNKDIVGIIEIKDNDHISLLFVDEKFQNEAIARSLIKKSIELCLENKPYLTEISVNSSPNAVKIYEKLGFKQTGPEQLFKGIRFVPMMLKLSELGHKNLKLIEPSIELESEFFAMVEEHKTDGKDIINGIGSIDIENFKDSVHQAKDHVRGIGLPEGWVPASTYWLICQKRIIGTCNLRHKLNDFLREFGGHVGYSIRPSERRKGFGTQMLRLLLEKAQELGIEHLLVTCDDNNIASARVIEKNSGKLADKVIKDDSKVPIRRYWIDLAI